jgi:predicted RNase H-like HicB family nuclease
MLEYHAAYYPIEDGWYMAKVLDFPGAVSQGRTLRSARRMIRDALEGLAEFLLDKGEPLPKPNLRAKDKAAVYMEKITLKVRCSIGSTDETAEAPAPSSRPRVRLRAGGS